MSAFGPPCLVTSPGTFCRGPHAGASQHGVVLAAEDPQKGQVQGLL
jgi:hypothetical protein